MKDTKESNLNHSEKASKASPGNSRRRIIKKAILTGGVVAGSSALPAKWVRPVVDSVILPSHADTTDDTGILASNVTTTTVTPTVNYYFDTTNDLTALPGNNLIDQTRSFAERTLDTIIPTASAIAPNSTPVYICLAVTGNTYTGRIIRELYPYLYQDYAGVSGTAGVALPLTNPAEPCSSTGLTSVTMTVEQLTPTSCRCTFVDDFGSVAVTVNQAACGQPNLTCQD